MAEKGQGKLRHNEAIGGYFFLLPNIFGFLVFLVGPIIASLYISFNKWGLFGSPQFIGLANFAKLAQDRVFQKVLMNTIYYTLGTVPIGILLAFFFALLVNKKIKGIIVFRTIYFLPTITMMVAVAIVWSWIYQSDIGLFNFLLRKIGIRGPRWLFDTRWAMPAIIIMSIWKGLGYNMLIYLAGLQGIPDQYYEAAEMAGANRWQKMLYITVPLLSPTTFFVLVMSLIGSFQVFQQAYIMTQGGPAYATTTIVYYIFLNGFQWSKMGYAAAVAWVLFAIIFTITLIQWIFAKKWVFGFFQ